MRPAVLLALALVLAPGCIKRVTVISDPPGATVHRGRKALGTTPIELTVLPIPFARQPVRVGLSGYRGEYVYVGRNLGLFRRATTHEVVLIKAHGPSGTWTPEDAAEQ